MPCDLACKTKIILNGGRVIREVQSAVDMTQSLEANGGEVTEEEAYQLIAILDVAEDKLIAFNDRMLAKTGYKRRTPKAKL